jgi:hypothetical protein
MNRTAKHKSGGWEWALGLGLIAALLGTGPARTDDAGHDRDGGGR